jgi:hypothetical protein
MESPNNTQEEPGEERGMQPQEVNKREPEHDAKDQQEKRPDDGSKTQSENGPRNGTDSEQVKEPGNNTIPEQDNGQIDKKENQPENQPGNDANNGTQNGPGDTSKVENDHKQGSRETSINEGNALSPSPKQRPNRTSLDDLQKWSQSRTWKGAGPAGASRISLPPSGPSSIVSSGPSKTGQLPPGHSLEQLMLRPENIALPKPVTKKKPPEQSAFMRWVTGGPSSTSKKKSKKVLAPPPPPVAPEVLAYRDNVNQLASHFSNFRNIADARTRHGWSPRIVFYDRVESAQSQVPRRHEPWKSRAFAPPYQEFYSTLRKVSDDCVQRMILVEDLTPSLIDLLGATFQIPPHVFEEHLDRSGYRTVLENRDNAAAWYPRSSAQGYSSITWYRPVLPLIPITSRFRAKLITNRKPTVRCIFDGCGHHNIRLGTLANIWRRHLELCPEPGVYHKDSQTEYPVGWEERATIWTRDFDGCKFGMISP